MIERALHGRAIGDTEARGVLLVALSVLAIDTTSRWWHPPRPAMHEATVRSRGVVGAGINPPGERDAEPGPPYRRGAVPDGGDDDGKTSPSADKRLYSLNVWRKPQPPSLVRVT